MTHFCLFCKNELIKKIRGCFNYAHQCLSCNLEYHIKYQNDTETIDNVRLDMNNFYIEYTKYWYQDKVMFNIVSRITKYDAIIMHGHYIEEKKIYHTEYDSWNNLIPPQNWINKLSTLLSFS